MDHSVPCFGLSILAIPACQGRRRAGVDSKPLCRCAIQHSGMYGSSSQEHRRVWCYTVERGWCALRIEKRVCAHEAEEQIPRWNIFHLFGHSLKHVLTGWRESSKVDVRNIRNNIHQHVVDMCIQDAGYHEAASRVDLPGLRTSQR